MPAQTLASYVGEYRYQYDRIKITHEKGELASTGPAGRCGLRPFTQTKFYCVGVDLEFNFQNGKSGSVTGVVAEYPDHYSDDYTKMKFAVSFFFHDGTLRLSSRHIFPSLWQLWCEFL